jgi:hypothetical protein
MENLTVRNMTSSDPSEFLFGIAILDSQNVVVRDSLFEFISVAHKEAVEIFDSYVDVDNIEVRGGGAGVNFSYRGGTCDPLNRLMMEIMWLLQPSIRAHRQALFLIRANKSAYKKAVEWFSTSQEV